MTVTCAQMIERLRNVGDDPVYDWIGPREAAEIAVELERLREIERRAISVDTGGVDQPVGVLGRATARYILIGTS